MLPRITNHNYTMADNLNWPSSSATNKLPRDTAIVSRDKRSRDIYDENHNASLPRIQNALEAADVAIQYVNKAKFRQDYYFERAESYHRKRYQDICNPLAKLKPMPSDSFLRPMGQNFGYPEKRCFDPTLGGVTIIPRHGDGTTTDVRVGDYGQSPPSGIPESDMNTSTTADSEMLQLKYFR
jgi:hypothetical protein